MDTLIFRTDRKEPGTYVAVYKKSASFLKKEIYYAKFWYRNKLHTIYDIEEVDVKQFCKLFSIVFEIADRKIWNFNKDKMIDHLYPFIRTDLYYHMWRWFNGGFDIQEFEDSGVDFILRSPTFLLESKGDKCHVYIHDSRETASVKYEDSYNEYITREEGEFFLAVLGMFVEQLGMGYSSPNLPYHRGFMSSWSFEEWTPTSYSKAYIGTSHQFIDCYIDNCKPIIV